MRETESACIRCIPESTRAGFCCLIDQEKSRPSRYSRRSDGAIFQPYLLFMISESLLLQMAEKKAHLLTRFCPFHSRCQGLLAMSSCRGAAACNFLSALQLHHRHCGIPLLPAPLPAGRECTLNALAVRDCCSVNGVHSGSSNLCAAVAVAARWSVDSRTLLRLLHRRCDSIFCRTAANAPHPNKSEGGIG